MTDKQKNNFAVMDHHHHHHHHSHHFDLDSSEYDLVEFDQQTQLRLDAAVDRLLKGYDWTLAPLAQK